MYKAVDAALEIRTSIAVQDTSFSLEYPLDKWVEAKIGGILVFETIEEAQSFIYGFSCWEIWRCDVDTPVPLPPYRLCNIVITHESTVKGFWECKDWGYVPQDVMSQKWPSGTHAFKKIKLVSCVDADPIMDRSDRVTI